MSLDFYLQTDPNPHVCPHCDREGIEKEELFSSNITHNLGKMARAAGIYDALWHPNDKGQVRSGILTKAIIHKIFATTWQRRSAKPFSLKGKHEVFRKAPRPSLAKEAP